MLYAFAGLRHIELSSLICDLNFLALLTQGGANLLADLRGIQPCKACLFWRRRILVAHGRHSGHSLEEGVALWALLRQCALDQRAAAAAVRQLLAIGVCIKGDEISKIMSMLCQRPGTDMPGTVADMTDIIHSSDFAFMRQSL